MKRLGIFILTLVVCFGFFVSKPLSQDDSEEKQEQDDSQESMSDEELDQKKKEIEELEAKLQEVQGEKQTLSSTINYLNNKIKLTEAEIDQTQNQLKLLKNEIVQLANEIEVLDKSLDEISEVLVNRINNTYKRSRMNPWLQILSSNDLDHAVSRFKYLQVAQVNDRQIMYDMEAARVNFNNQKELKEQKQEELDLLTVQLESQKTSLDSQQAQKQQLLTITRNDEKRFQSELAQKRAELEAIQSIIAGKGDETEVGDVSEGDKIASVIPGPSTCSSGAHLHFEVASDGVHRNPSQYLSGKSVIWDNNPDGPFDFNGSWSWPLNDSVRITQGYGYTFYAGTMRYYGGAPHTGIDMVNNNDYTVKAVKSGVLYRGAIACGRGTLRYVRVEHDDNISSYYLHVNY